MMFHKKMYNYLSNYYNENDENVLIKKIVSKLTKLYNLDDHNLLGIGGEAFVYTDYKKVKKFIIRWEKLENRNNDIDMTFTNLKGFSEKIKQTEYLYNIEVNRICNDVLLVTYPYEESVELTETFIRKNWHNFLKKQFCEFQNEILKTGYFFTNLNARNFRLVNNKMKFIDFGRDILEADMAIREMGRMFFMMLNNVYDLGV